MSIRVFQKCVTSLATTVNLLVLLLLAFLSEAVSRNGDIAPTLVKKVEDAKLYIAVMGAQFVKAIA